MTEPEQPASPSGKRLAFGLLLVVWLAVGIVFVFSGWADSRFMADFIPPDRSYVGPNLVASVIQWAAVGFVFALVYPPLRHWIERELDHFHAKLDHVIENHPDIPNLPDHMRGRPWSRRKK